VRKNTGSTLARLAERQQEVTRLEESLCAALAVSDTARPEEPGAPKARLDAAPIRRRATELKREAEELAQVLKAATAQAERHRAAAQAAPEPTQQNVMLESLFRFLQHDAEPQR